MAILAERILDQAPENIDIREKDVLWRIISEIESPSNTERKRKEFKAFEVYAGNQIKYINNGLSAKYPQTYKEFSVSDISISKRVTDKRSQAYSQEPMRTLTTDNDTELYSDLLKQGKFNQVMKVFDQTYNRHWRAGLWVQPPKQLGGAFRFRPLMPYEYDLVVDFTGNPVVVAIKMADYETTQNESELSVIQRAQGTSKNVKIYGFWTKDYHAIVKYTKTINAGELVSDIELMPVEGNEAMINELGVLPFSFKQMSYDDEMPFVNPLADQSITFNVLNSTFLTVAEVQGFSNLTISGIGEIIDQDLPMSLFSAFKIRQPDNPDLPATSVDYISPSPDLSGMKSAIDAYLIQVLKDHGIDTGDAVNSDGGQKFSSGFDRLLSMANVQKIVEENQTTYSEVEQEVYDIIRAYSMALGLPVFGDENISIHYKKPKPMQSEMELLDIIQKKKDLGLIEDWEKFIILDPNMSPDAAKQKLLNIQEERLGAFKLFTGASIEQGSEEEANDSLRQRRGSNSAQDAGPN